MPTRTGKDSKGCFAQWGSSGKKYYYTCNNSSARKAAKAKANKQGAAAHAAGYTGNQGDHPMIFRSIIANFSPIVRHDKMEGRDYLVAPMVMLTEGVHEGSDGPGYYPADEIAKVPVVWNHKPVVVYHPQQNGQMLSACDPIVISSRKIGVIMNAKYEDDVLKAEAWLEADRIAAVDDRVGTAIENNQMMELSTGLYTDKEDVEGMWNDEPYTWVARNFRPDHLALLPDLKGACSMEDGAGFLRLNEKTKKFETFKVSRKDVLTMVANEMSHESVRSLLRSALNEKKEDAWIEDVYDEFFVFEENGALYAQTYTVKEGNISIAGLPEPVVRVTEYRTTAGAFVGNQEIKKKGNIMDKEKTVQSLIDNEATTWAEDDREFLMGQEDDKLEKFIPVANEDDTDDNKDGKKEKPTDNKDNKDNKDDKDNKEKPTDNKDDKITDNAKPKPQTAEEYVAAAPEGVREVLNQGMATLQAQKDHLIKVITGNERNTFSEDSLKEKAIDELSALARLAAPSDEEETEPGKAPIYIGQGSAGDGGSKEEPLALPVMNFGEKQAG